MNALSLGNSYKLNGPEKSSLHNCMDFGVEELSPAHSRAWLIHTFYILGVSWPADCLSHCLISGFDPQ